ncbi:MAG: VanW family protein [bacterium]|nr:VanW family protein [bacterium]
MTKKLLSQRHPIFYFLSVWEKRIRRSIMWLFDKKTYTKDFTGEKLSFRMRKHQSVLLKKLGESDMRLQYNKVTNLAIAIGKIDGILIKPGETFSFCKLVGLPTKRKGYLEGMELSGGEARPGIGGGICQVSNLIHWLVIHTPLTVTERHHHSFDPFPDEGRVLPFGSGATVFYNYLDYRFINNTSFTFQVNLRLTERLLEGEIRVNEKQKYSYHVYEKDHEFLREEGKYFRKNEIWRNKMDIKMGGRIVETELLTKNYAEVKYVPEQFK